MKEYSIEEVSHIVRPKLGEDIPLTLYRILRVIGMRNILGETSGATLYMMGKQVGTMIGAKDLGEFEEKIKELKVGIPEVQVIDEDHVIVKLYEGIFKKKAKSTQTKSWSVGYSYCEFEVILY
jgi:predicted hydrocarbon binding protein